MITTILALLFVFVIPGFLLTQILFKKSDLIEKITLSIIHSISILIVIGMALGFNEVTYKLTGGITEVNLWLAIIGVNVILLGVYLYKNKKK